MALVIIDNCSWFIEILPEPEVFSWDYEEYISETLWYKVDDITWITIDTIRFFWEENDIWKLQNWLQSYKKLEEIKEQIQQWFNWYNELYKPILTESEDIETYGTNEFFWGKREAYEDMLEFIEKINK